MDALYDSIGVGYDTTRRPDPRIAARLRYHLAPDPDGLYLDLACGTGNYTAALGSDGVALVGLDRAITMLRAAQVKAPQVPWCQGDALALPFADGAFQGVLCSLAIHHFPDRAAAFAEVRRVLARGRFVIFTSTPEQESGYWLNHYFPEMMVRSGRIMPSLATLRGELEAAGFRFLAYDPWDVPPDPVDLMLYAGKHRPALYLDAAFRRGTSGFAKFCEPHEIRGGLQRLETDIASGKIDDVIAGYAHDRGDYGFAVAE